MTWIQTGKWDRHIGTYRAIATTSLDTVKPGSLVQARGAGEEAGPSLSWTERNSIKNPEPILLFSNFNFTQLSLLLSKTAHISPPLSSLTDTSE